MAGSGLPPCLKRQAVIWLVQKKIRLNSLSWFLFLFVSLLVSNRFKSKSLSLVISRICLMLPKYACHLEQILSCYLLNSYTEQISLEFNIDSSVSFVRLSCNKDIICLRIIVKQVEVEETMSFVNFNKITI